MGDEAYPARRRWLVLAPLALIKLAAVAAAVFWYWHRPPNCLNVIAGEALAPGGQARAVLFVRHCASPAVKGVEISILEAGASFGDAPGNVFGAENAGIVEGGGRVKSTGVQALWRSDTELVIRHPAKAVIYRKAAQFGQVRIVLEPITP